MIKKKRTVIWNSHYTAEQCKQIEDICLTFPEKDATTIGVRGTEEIDDIRRSKIRFVKMHDMEGDFMGASHLSVELFKLCETINDNYFKFKLGGVDSIQYTEYDASYSGHYGWHTDWDWSIDMNPIRKLSMTIQLSDGSEYKGGDFEIAHELEIGDPNTKTLGTVICFPSFIHHRVTPITHGLRKSLVVWFTGPNFE